MYLLFYTFGLLAIISAFFVIYSKKAIKSLLYLIVFLISLSCIFFTVGAYFAGVIEILLYVGAIMILFIFTIMMFNTDIAYIEERQIFLKLDKYILYIMLSVIIAIYLIFFTKNLKFSYLTDKVIELKSIGIDLFGIYIIIVELISLIMLSSLIIVCHICNTKTINLKN